MYRVSRERVFAGSAALCVVNIAMPSRSVTLVLQVEKSLQMTLCMMPVGGSGKDKECDYIVRIVHLTSYRTFDHRLSSDTNNFICNSKMKGSRYMCQEIPFQGRTCLLSFMNNSM